eukprot:scaffold25377_cov53-Attheya_sp.AAC.4
MSQASKVLVVGSGTIGLRTALELLRKNVSVSLRSPRHPLHPSTCSMGAGGLWMPYKCEDARMDKWALQTLDELMPMAAGTAGSTGDSAVEIVPAVMLKRHHHGPKMQDFLAKDYDGGGGGNSPLPAWTKDSRLAFQHLTVEMLWWQNEIFQLRIPSQAELVEAGYLYAWLFNPPIVDAPRMLQSMLTEVQLHPYTLDVNVETGVEYESLEEMVEDAKEGGYDAVVNCTGLGSSKLCGDEDSMVGGRGVLLHYDRTCERRADVHGGRSMPNDVVILTEEAPWGSDTDACYIIPRGDVLVVGGSFHREDTHAEVRPMEKKRLMQNAHLMGIDTEKSPIVDEWTGFRPHRPSIRLEIDKHAGISEGIQVVHNYGHGGSGWTVFVGAAKQVAALLGHGDKQ